MQVETIKNFQENPFLNRVERAKSFMDRGVKEISEDLEDYAKKNGQEIL